MDHFLLNIHSGESIVPPAKFSASVDSLDGHNIMFNSIIIYLTKCPLCENRFRTRHDETKSQAFAPAETQFLQNKRIGVKRLPQ
jgi:hypothetical protein